MNAEIQHISKLSFWEIDDPNVLVPLLQERHPQSCFIYNQVISHSRFKDELTFYTLGQEINSTTWITSLYTRKDCSTNVTISIFAPSTIREGKQQIPLNVKEAFSSGQLIRWDEGVMFVALEKPVSQMIFDISANVKGCITDVHPCVLYYMDNQDALNLEINTASDVAVRRLLADKESDFILSTWKYPDEDNVPLCIAANASGGVFVNGKCVSGVITKVVGLLSALYTLREYRNKGYAKLTMTYAFKETSRDGCIPCLTVEYKNERSKAFHQSIGAKKASVVDWIEIKVLDVD